MHTIQIQCQLYRSKYVDVPVTLDIDLDWSEIGAITDQSGDGQNNQNKPEKKREHHFFSSFTHPQLESW